jgi:dihydroorotate dehydrogenase (fumarate)
MADLHTTYLGLPLPHPIVASASPISKSLDGVRRLEDGGAAAIVLASLFEEQIRQENEMLERLTALGADSHGEATAYFPSMPGLEAGPDAYLDLVNAAKRAVSVPIIASLNGSTPSGWVKHAALLEQAGADAIELNVFFVPADLSLTGRDVERRCEQVVRAVCDAVTIPVAVKVSPFFSAMGDMAGRFAASGARGLVLFNRFYQPDFDLDRLEVSPTVELSTSSEVRLPLLWIALLHGRVPVSLAASTGVHTAADAVKYLLAGADAVMTTSALLRHGPGAARALASGIDAWLEQKGLASVATIRGAMSQRHVADPEAFERANYMRILGSWPG